MKGKSKSISKGNFTRTNEGLYCHHIDENKYLNLTDKRFIKQQEPPFDVQRKDRLVYCDLNEHTILHALIAKETNYEFGSPGLISHLFPNIKKWYVDSVSTETIWERNCFNKAYLSPEDAVKLITNINLTLEKDLH